MAYIIDRDIPIPPKRSGRPRTGKTKAEHHRAYRERQKITNITVDEATLDMAKRVKDKLSEQFGQKLSHKQVLSYLFSKEL